jgi:hypothetical protein
MAPAGKAGDRSCNRRSHNDTSRVTLAEERQRGLYPEKHPFGVNVENPRPTDRRLVPPDLKRGKYLHSREEYRGCRTVVPPSQRPFAGSKVRYICGVKSRSPSCIAQCGGPFFTRGSIPGYKQYVRTAACQRSGNAFSNASRRARD